MSLPATTDDEDEYRPCRIIYCEKDLIRECKRRRQSLGMTMEELSEYAGMPDRYWNKVEIGLVSKRRRELRQKMLGRRKPKSSTVRRPFRMMHSMAWFLEALGLCLVVMPLEEADKICEPDVISDFRRRKAKREAR